MVAVVCNELLNAFLRENKPRKYSCEKINGRIKHADKISIADRVYANRLGNENISSSNGSK